MDEIKAPSIYIAMEDKCMFCHKTRGTQKKSYPKVYIREGKYFHGSTVIKLKRNNHDGKTICSSCLIRNER